LASLSYPNGLQTNFGYYPNIAGGGGGNGDNRLESISNLSASAANISTYSYTYELTGAILTWSTQLDSAAAQTASFQYDSAQELIGASLPTTVSGPPQAASYQFDLAGNRTLEQVDNNITTSSYNNLNEVSSLASGGMMTFSGTMSAPGTITLAGNAGSVDPFGNWIAAANVVVGGNILTLVATDLNGNVANKTVDITATGAGSRTLSYDSNGNILNNGAGETYAWDAENRLVRITQSSGITGFVYNGLGQRIQETLNGVVTKQWIWGSGPQPLEERDASGNVTKRFFGAFGEQIGGNNYYFTFDHLGSVREVVNASGIIQSRYSYDPYGRRTLLSGTDLADFGVSGLYYHSASGLYLTEFRAFDPNLGRWLSRDPLGEYAGTNAYNYCDGDPINNGDPLGLCDAPAVFAPIDVPQAYLNSNGYPRETYVAAVRGLKQQIVVLSIVIAVPVTIAGVYMAPEIANTPLGRLILSTLIRLVEPTLDNDGGQLTFKVNPVPKNIIEERPQMEPPEKPTPGAGPPGTTIVPIGGGAGRGPCA
jgi:RHS repeat-associated protein